MSLIQLSIKTITWRLSWIVMILATHKQSPWTPGTPWGTWLLTSRPRGWCLRRVQLVAPPPGPWSPEGAARPRDAPRYGGETSAPGVGWGGGGEKQKGVKNDAWRRRKRGDTKKEWECTTQDSKRKEMEQLKLFIGGSRVVFRSVLPPAASPRGTGAGGMYKVLPHDSTSGWKLQTVTSFSDRETWGGRRRTTEMHGELFWGMEKHLDRGEHKTY